MRRAGQSGLIKMKNGAKNIRVESRLAELFTHLGLERAHFGVQNSAELDPIIAARPDLIASLAMAGPNRLQAEVIAPVADRLMLFYGDGGAGAEVVVAVLAEQPAIQNRIQSHCLANYTVLTWTDVLGERGGEIVPLWRDFLKGADDRKPATVLEPDNSEGEVAGITYRARGRGPALVLLPMLLSPSQWEPIVDALAEDYCVISLGGRYLGGVSFIDGRGRDPGYVRAVRSHVDEIEIKPGETILDVGCGPGTLDRWLARRTKGANPIRAVDVNGYFLREAASLAKVEGLDDIITFGHGNAEDLPFDDNSFDVVMSHTVMEECNAEKMLAQMIRVAKPGGRVAVMVRATDRRSLWNMPLDDAVREIVEAPVPSVGADGCADVSLYRRFAQSGLGDLRLFPAVMTITDPNSYNWRYYEPYIFSLLDEAGLANWRQAKAQAITDGSILMSRWAHCAVGTKVGTKEA